MQHALGKLTYRFGTNVLGDGTSCVRSERGGSSSVTPFFDTRQHRSTCTSQGIFISFFFSFLLPTKVSRAAALAIPYAAVVTHDLLA